MREPKEKNEPGTTIRDPNKITQNEYMSPSALKHFLSLTCLQDATPQFLWKADQISSLVATEPMC